MEYRTGANSIPNFRKSSHGQRGAWSCGTVLLTVRCNSGANPKGIPDRRSPDVLAHLKEGPSMA